MSTYHIRKKVLLSLLAGSILHAPAAFAADTNTENGGVESPNSSSSEVYGFDNDMDSYDLGTVVITARREPLSELTNKNDYAGGQVSRKLNLGSLGERDFLNTPFSVTGYTAKFIEDTQAQTVDDVVANDPSVHTQSGSTATNLWTIRGFDLQSQDMSYNGLYGIAPNYQVSMDAIERVEVFKGPSVLLHGMSPNGSVGGTINLIPKRAENKPLKRFTMGFGNGRQTSEHLDLGQRFGENNKYGIRFNISHRNGATVRDDEKDKMTAATIAFDIRGSRSRFALDAGYLHRVVKNASVPLKFSDAVLAQITSPPTLTDNTRNFGSRGTIADSKDTFGMARYEYDMSKDWMAYAAVGFRKTEQDYSYNAFRLMALPDRARVLNYYYPKESRANTQLIGVRGKARTGSIDHQISIAASRLSITSYSRSTSLNNYYTSFSDPVWQPLTGNFNKNLVKSGETLLSGISISDVLSTADDRWQFILGGRFQKIDQKNYRQSDGKQTGHYDKSAFSPAFALIHKFNERMSVYANYIEGFQQGTIVNDSDADNNGEMFAPYKTKQYEIGAKYDMGKIAATISAFSTKMPTYLEKPTTPGRYLVTQDGEVRHRGIELNVFGEPQKGFRLLGGLMILDAKKTNTAGGALNGKYEMAAPRLTAVLNGEYDIPSAPGLTVTGRLTHTGAAYINPANTVRVPSYMTFDLGLRYKFQSGKTPMTLRLNVNNLFDRKYWQARAYGVTVGAPRTFMLSLSADL